MSIFTLRTGANAHPEGSVLQTITDQIETSGVYSLTGNDFKVQAQGTPDLTVKVLLGRAYIEAVLGNTYPIRADADTNVSIPGNSSGNPRIDALVLYIDLSAAPNSDASNVATLAIVQGTPAPSPVAPTDGTIQTSIGASNPFLRLANISVISGATSITNPDITDTRSEVVWVIGGVKNTKGYFNIKEQSASPGTPPAGSIVIYGKTDNKVYKKDDLGVESEIGSGGGGATDIITGEVPAGAINGVNDTFTTASNFATGALRVYKNGVRMKGGGVDFAEVGSNSFQMNVPPASGTILIVDYFKVATVASQGSTSFIYNETPSGAINGANLNFATAFPYIGGTLMVYRDGQLMVPGVSGDYTETNPATGLFDFFIAPATGSIIRVSYQKSLSVTGNADTVDGFHANSIPTANQIPVLDGSANIPVNTVDTNAIEDNAVSNPKIANDAITTAKILDGQITQPKLAPGVGGNADHSFRIRRTVAQSIANATFTNITWDIDQFDTDDLHSLSINTDRVTITAATAGKWLFAVNGIWGGGASGQKIVRILKNGGAIAEEAGPTSGGNAHVQNLSVIVDVVGGDTIYVDAYQDSGAAQNFGNASIGEVWFSGIRIAT